MQVLSEVDKEFYTIKSENHRKAMIIVLRCILSPDGHPAARLPPFLVFMPFSGEGHPFFPTFARLFKTCPTYEVVTVQIQITS